jgi:uncharacterized protein (TIGR02611 family)
MNLSNSPDFHVTHSDIEAIVADVADDPISRPHQIARVIWRIGKRLVITLVGFAVVVAGVVMLVVPGPGLLVIIAGLAILATEFVWAERALKKARQKAEQGVSAAKGALSRKKSPPSTDPDPH